MCKQIEFIATKIRGIQKINHEKSRAKIYIKKPRHCIESLYIIIMIKLSMEIHISIFTVYLKSIYHYYISTDGATGSDSDTLS